MRSMAWIFLRTCPSRNLSVQVLWRGQRGWSSFWEFSYLDLFAIRDRTEVAG